MRLFISHKLQKIKKILDHDASNFVSTFIFLRLKLRNLRIWADL